MSWDKMPGAFFRLADSMIDPPNLRLGRHKRDHKWRIIFLLMKLNMFKKIELFEITDWTQLVWRPIISYAGNAWQRWYALLGDTMTLMARTLFHLGDAVMSTHEVQRRVFSHNLRFIGDTGAHT